MRSAVQFTKSESTTQWRKLYAQSRSDQNIFYAIAFISSNYTQAFRNFLFKAVLPRSFVLKKGTWGLISNLHISMVEYERMKFNYNGWENLISLPSCFPDNLFIHSSCYE